MSRIFISHSGANNAAALALAGWFTEQGWGDYFLDIAPDRGLSVGQRWQEALRAAADRCEAVIFLVSPQWRDSRWCLAEFHQAKLLGKVALAVLVEETALNTLPVELIAEWQICNLVAGEARRTFQVAQDPIVPPTTVSFAEAGLHQLRTGLTRAGISAMTFAWPPPGDPARAPYRGMKPLEREDAAIFLGRDADLIRATDAVRELRDRGLSQMLVLLGASGSGKSSFLRAGLWPRLQRDDRRFLPLPVIRPGRAAIHGPTGLVAALDEAFRQRKLKRTRIEIRDAVMRPGGFVQLLQGLQASAARLQSSEASPSIVVAIDQAEELLHQEKNDESDSLCALLQELAAAAAAGSEANGRIAAFSIMSIRSDSYGALQADQRLHNIRRVPFDLGPLVPSAFKSVIEGPAKRATEAGSRLSIDPMLTERLLIDSVGPDALPLLAFTLERLFVEGGGDGTMALADYEALGGIRGAIEAVVSTAFKDPEVSPRIPAGQEEQERLLRLAFVPWLAQVDPISEQRTRRVARWSEIPAESSALVERLVESRLLVRDSGPSGNSADTTIEIAHEALLRQWSTLEEWLSQDADSLKALARVRQVCAEWQHHDRRSSWLVHRGDRLRDAEALLRRQDFARMLVANDLDGAAYLRACRARERADRALGRLSAALLTSAALLFSYVGARFVLLTPPDAWLPVNATIHMGEEPLDPPRAEVVGNMNVGEGIRLAMSYRDAEANDAAGVAVVEVTLEIDRRGTVVRCHAIRTNALSSSSRETEDCANRYGLPDQDFTPTREAVASTPAMSPPAAVIATPPWGTPVDIDDWTSAYAGPMTASCGDTGNELTVCLIGTATDWVYTCPLQDDDAGRPQSNAAECWTKPAGMPWNGSSQIHLVEGSEPALILAAPTDGESPSKARGLFRWTRQHGWVRAIEWQSVADLTAAGNGRTVAAVLRYEDVKDGGLPPDLPGIVLSADAGATWRSLSTGWNSRPSDVPSIEAVLSSGEVFAIVDERLMIHRNLTFWERLKRSF